jgi:2-C-methyl-D-erythritol 4-phosphate cytidylyltransferase
VLVHDAARPLASTGLVSRVLGGLTEGADGVVPVVPLADTVKRVSHDRVTGTLDRSDLRVVQTPQAFVAARLRTAFQAPVEQLRGATDCASLLEAAGMVVATVAGEGTNLKVTDADDLRLAEALA